MEGLKQTFAKCKSENRVSVPGLNGHHTPHFVTHG